VNAGAPRQEAHRAAAAISLVRFKLVALSCALLLGTHPAGTAAQLEPKSAVDLAINGVFYLCPQLVRGGKAPPADMLARLGFTTAPDSAAGKLEFYGSSAAGGLAARFDPANGRCTIGYGGRGYEQIAGVIRDTVVHNKFRRITGGDKDGAKADVFEGPAPDSPATVRIIIIENYTNPSASIAYSER
jgi:hypothetical protein